MKRGFKEFRWSLTGGEMPVGVIAIAAMLFLASCTATSEMSAPPDADDDDGGEPIDFYAFCCDQRCEDFEIFDGTVEFGVPTWHRLEAGISLEGERVVLSATDENAGMSEMSPACYLVTVIADKDPDAALWLEVDVLDDGENVAVKSIPAKDWSTSRFEFRAPAESSEMRFSLVKQGDSRAVLYFIEIDGIFSCHAYAEEVDP